MEQNSSIKNEQNETNAINLKYLRIICGALYLGQFVWIMIFSAAFGKKAFDEPVGYQDTPLNGLWGFYIVTVVLVVIQVIFTVKLAKRLKRDAAIWGTIAVITTGLSSLVLAFLGEKGEASVRKTWTPSYSSGFSSSYQVLQKTCGACGRIVSVSAHAGQSCPHCGAYWGEEKTKYR